MKKNYTPRIAVTLLFLTALFAFAAPARACHGIALVNFTINNTGSGLDINASSDPASCGCGPYYLEVQVNSAAFPFTTTVPASNSSAWGQIPWFHSLLNVPNYNQQNGWPDNCVLEPYTQLSINFGSLCSGTAYTLRAREFPINGTPGPWTTPYSFTTPGIAPVLMASISVSNTSPCVNSTVSMSGIVTGSCAGYTFSWSPTTNLSNPNSLTTNALITGPISYTLTVTDPVANQTAQAVMTFNPLPLPVMSSVAMVETTCNGATGTFTPTVSGNGPFTYYWTPSNQTTMQATNLAIGTYTLTVTDANGCVDTASYVMQDSCDFVWPGDANDDGVADINDMLAIGIGNGTNGTVRANASLNWIGQPSAPWGPTLLNGTDYKWIDCDGNGSINLNDTVAVIQNFALTHNNRWGMPPYALTNPNLRLEFSNDTLAAGSNGTINVYLGDLTVPGINIYGLAATLDFDYQQLPAQNMGIDISSTWLGTNGTDLFAIKHAVPNSGQLDFAVTRYDQTAVGGYGLIARIPFTAGTTLLGSGTAVQVPLSFSYLNIIDANETPVLVNIITDTLTVYDPGPLLADAQTAAETQLTVSPNPANDFVNLSWNTGDNYTLRVFDPAGRLVQQARTITGNSYTMQTATLPAGMYMVQLQNEKQTMRARLVITK